MPSLPSTQDSRAYFSGHFSPGRWIDRREIVLPSFTAVTGCYERHESIPAKWHSREMHYFDLCLASRPVDSQGRLKGDLSEPRMQGEVFFVPAGCSYKGEAGAGLQRNLFIFLEPGNFDDSLPMPESLPAPLLRECMNLRNDRIRSLLTEIGRELYEPGFASRRMLEGLGITLQAETSRFLSQQLTKSKRNGGLSHANFLLIRDRVLAGESLPTVAELAKLCNLSERHLMRAFRQETGQTIGEFIQQTSLDRARELLKISDDPIHIIAGRIGFSNPSAFSTAFRRVTGYTPRQYRSRQRALVRRSS